MFKNKLVKHLELLPSVPPQYALQSAITVMAIFQTLGLCSNDMLYLRDSKPFVLIIWDFGIFFLLHYCVDGLVDLFHLSRTSLLSINILWPWCPTCDTLV